MSFVSVDAQGHTLRSDAAASYKRLLLAGMPAGGIQVFQRTMAQQEKLWEAHQAGRGPVAARPSLTAPHIKQVAMDFKTTGSDGSYSPSSAFAWAMKGTLGSKSPRQIGHGEYARINDFGWIRSVPSERWHLQYYPELDKAANLKRGVYAKHATPIVQTILALKADGYFGPDTEKAVKQFQKSRGLKADGVIGSKTWQELAKYKKEKETPVPPKPQPVPTPPAPPIIVDQDPVPTHPADPIVVEPPAPPARKVREFRLISLNVKAQRFGGLRDDDADVGEYIKDQKPSLILGQEMSETRRNRIRKTLGMDNFLTHPQGYVCTMWATDDSWQHVGDRRTALRTGFHAAVRTTVRDEREGAGEMDIISVHLPSKDSFPKSWSPEEVLKEKLNLLRTGIKTVYRPGVPTIIGGDFNTSHAVNLLVKEFGFERVTPNVDTLDAEGDQKIDAIVKKGDEIEIREVHQLNPGRITDHKVWLFQGSLVKTDKN